MPYSDGAVSPIRSGPKVPKKKKKKYGVSKGNGQNQWENKVNERVILAKNVCKFWSKLLVKLVKININH